MCWQLEKLMKEHDAKLAAADKEAVNKAIEKTRAAAKGEDIEAIKAAVHELEQASHALSRTLYASAGAKPGPAGPADGPSTAPRASPAAPPAAAGRRGRGHRRRVRGEGVADRSLLPPGDG